MLRRLAVLVILLPAALGVFGVPGASAEPKPRTVTIGAKDFVFDFPASIEGGTVKAVLDNTGAEQHQANFIRLEPGTDQGELLGALAEDFQGAQSIATFEGGPNGTGPGEKTSAIQRLAPGDYVLACLLPSPDGIPHVLKGMAQPLTVTKPAKTPTQAKPRTTALELRDHEFDAPKSFDGTGNIAISNEGEEIHEVVVGKLPDGSTVQDVIEWGSSPLFTPFPFPQPYEDVGGITGLSPKGRSRINVGKLDPGRYSLFCFLPGPDGVSHIRLGMVYPFSVKA